jgi:uncharacterized membrane protein
MLSYLYQLFVSGALTFGVTTVYLRYRRKQEAPTELLFSGFSQYSRSLALFLLMAIFTCLWTLCLIIPGIIAYYRYRLAFFILVDNPNIGPLEAINISKELMRGNKWKLFCLDLSFIGWALVAWIVVVMSMLFLTAIVVGASTYSTDSILLLVIVQTAIISVVTGVLYMYMGTASAAFYERASGLLRYTDEVAPPSAGGSGFYG